MVLGFLFLSVLPRCSFSFPFLFYFLVNETFSHLFDPEMLSERTCTHGPVCTTRARGSQAALGEGTDRTGAVRPPGPSAGQRVHGPPFPPEQVAGNTRPHPERQREGPHVCQPAGSRDSSLSGQRGKNFLLSAKRGNRTPASPGRGRRRRPIGTLWSTERRQAGRLPA